jgi:deoxyribodipyrimidine photo-lyase
MIVQKFPTDLSSIGERLNNLDVLDYCKTRNYTHGTVSYLSPYISRGVLSTKKILENVANKNLPFHEIETFIKELMWRDYFQRVWMHRNIDIDIKNQQANVYSHQMPKVLDEASTGIEAIDTAIQILFTTGYMHNHMRMYTASLACNTLNFHWHKPAQWMYYHLLDGDWGSNACSWQWVCGSFSSKKYFANQENINKYTGSKQRNTLLDVSYEEIERIMAKPEMLHSNAPYLTTTLPESNMAGFNPNLPTFIYNYYQLDVDWHKETNGNRVLLLEPEVFAKYPVSEHCVKFMMDLGKNIHNILVYVGSFDSFKQNYQPTKLFYKEHPLVMHYDGIQEQRDWICNEFNEYHPSFFQYWKKCESFILNEYFN